MVSTEQLGEFLKERLGGVDIQVVERRPVGGGCIAQAECVTLRCGTSVFAKFLPKSTHHSQCALEAEGLSALRARDAIRIPEVLAVGDIGQFEILVLEWIDPGRQSPSFFTDFGRQLAEMHRRQTEDWFGWQEDNFLGASPQPNGAMTSWVEFFTERRLRQQVRMAKSNRVGTPELFRQIETLCQRLDQILGAANPEGSLLHGDLWSGNFLCDASGSPVVIDPAVYYGHREAELAMPLLFGGFPEEFFRAYHEAWPLEDGWETRVEIYKLYHYLNHLNLFGSSYLSSCLAITRRFV